MAERLSRRQMTQAPDGRILLLCLLCLLNQTPRTQYCVSTSSKVPGDENEAFQEAGGRAMPRCTTRLRGRERHGRDCGEHGYGGWAEWGTDGNGTGPGESARRVFEDGMRLYDGPRGGRGRGRPATHARGL